MKYFIYSPEDREYFERDSEEEAIRLVSEFAKDLGIFEQGQIHVIKGELIKIKIEMEPRVTFG